MPYSICSVISLGQNVPATILATGVLWGAICLDLAVQNTRLANRAKNVSQEVALLERRVAELEAQSDETRRTKTGS